VGFGIGSVRHRGRILILLVLCLVMFIGVNEVVIIFRDILGAEDNFIFCEVVIIFKDMLGVEDNFLFIIIIFCISRI